MWEDLLASHRSLGLCLAKLGRDQQAAEHLKRVFDARNQQLVELGLLRGAGHSPEATPGTPPPNDTADEGLPGGDGVDWSTLADGDENGLTRRQRDALLAAAAAAEDLGRCLTCQSKFSTAEELFWKALDARSRVLGCQHELVQKTEEQLRKCLEQQT
jgi:tetratricopeptide (TPR) repeat protein